MEGTGGNLSLRLPESSDKNRTDILITPSGVNKGYIREETLIPVRSDGPSHCSFPAGPFKPSYETPIHLAIYRAVPWAGAVFHVHPVYSVVLSRLHGHPAKLKAFRVPWMEILKGIGFGEGSEVAFPVLPNWQDVSRVGADLTAYLKKTARPAPGFILYQHGLTVWGRDVEEARNHLEVMEYACLLLYKNLLLNK